MAFDLFVHKRNAKGQLTDVQPYRLVVENGIQKFERPKGSGYWYDAAGVLIQKPEEKAPEPKAEPKPEPKLEVKPQFMSNKK